MGPVAGLALIVMGIVQWRRGRQTHDDPAEEKLGEKGLWGIAVFAFALAFAHEEEFAIVALCA